MNIETIYQTLCNTASDINEHLPTLKEYATGCEHVTEFGVRGIVSTWALLMGKPKVMVSYDILPINTNGVQPVDTHFSFIQGDTLKVDIDETDLLFIDTLHNYNQLKGELDKHSHKVRKWIIMHDTTTFGINGESYEGKSERGLWLAVEEFLKDNTDWILHKRWTNNNGLTILKKK